MSYIDIIFLNNIQPYLTKISEKSINDIKILLNSQDFNVQFQQMYDKTIVNTIDIVKKTILLPLAKYFWEYDKIKENIIKDIIDENFLINDVIIDEFYQKFYPFITGLKKNTSAIRSKFNRINRHNKVALNIFKNVPIVFSFYYNDNDYPDFGNSYVRNAILRRTYCMLNVFINDKYKYLYKNFVFSIFLFLFPRRLNIEYIDTPNEIDDYIRRSSYFNSTSGASFIDIFHVIPSYIFASRDNGILGLLVHEIGHVCGLDMGTIMSSGKMIKYIRRQFDLHFKQMKKLDISEGTNIGSFCEGINNGNSSIIHAIFNALELCKLADNYDKLHLYCKQFYRIEVIYYIYQTVRLLRWFRYANLESFILKNKQIYTQTAPMFEYIIIRLLYLLNFISCANYLYDNDDLRKPRVNINENELVNFIYDKLSNDMLFRSILNITFDLYDKQIKDKLKMELTFDKCGNCLMEYYAIDLRNGNIHKGGHINYYHKYLKYKTKYLSLKNM